MPRFRVGLSWFLRTARVRQRLALTVVALVRLAIVRTAADSASPIPFLITDPSLEVKVWATAPLVPGPTPFDFDADGRIWLIERTQSSGETKRPPEGDRIVILEDSHGEGKADRSSVFVQEPALRAAQGLAVIGNRVVIFMPPDLVVYTDVNGDRKFDPAIDRRDVLLTGFNRGNGDNAPRTVTVGPDGLWYFRGGTGGAQLTDKSGRMLRVERTDAPGPLPEGKPSKSDGPARDEDSPTYRGGFVARMNPDGTGLTLIGHNFGNGAGHTLTALGDVFLNDRDNGFWGRTTFLLEYGNAGFTAAGGTNSALPDRRPGQSLPTAEWQQEDPGIMPAGDVYAGGAPCSLAFVEDSTLGKKFPGLLLSCDPARHTVFGSFPRPVGAGFQLDRFDFLTSMPGGNFAGRDLPEGPRPPGFVSAQRFRPNGVSLGPDGAIYVSSFPSSPDVASGGTIYRVAPKGFKGRAPKLNLKSLSGALEGLRSPAVNVRGAAFYAIQSHGTKAIKPLLPWLKDPDPALRARAVWLLSTLGSEGRAAVEPMLRHPEPQMRLTAFRALGRQNQNVGPYARTLAEDPSPAVRREVAIALRDVSFAESKDLLLALAHGFDGLDRTYLEALGTGCRGKEAEFYDYARELLGDANPLRWSVAFARLAWRLHPPQSVADFRVRALLATVEPSFRRAALTAMGQNQTPEAAAALLEVAAQAGGPESQSVHIEALWWLLHRKDSAGKDFNVREQLKERGLYDPETVVLTDFAAPEPDAESNHFPPLTEIRQIRGSAARGAGTMNICYGCHRLGPTGTEYGPDLTGWVQRHSVEDFLQRLLHPIPDPALGYHGTRLTLTDGSAIHGRVVAEGDPLMLQGPGGRVQLVPARRVVARQRLNHSLMPNAEQLDLVPRDLMDLHAFLAR